MVPFIENTAWHASAMTILAISIERYCAICNPLQAPDWWTNHTLGRLLLFIWLFSSLLSIPFAVVAKTNSADFYDGSVVTVCSTAMSESWQKAYTIMVLIVFLFIPFLLMVVLYGIVGKRLLYDKCALDRNNDHASIAALKSRRQVVRMLVIVTIVFFFSSLPFRALSLVYVFDFTRMEQLGMMGNLALITFARTMVYLNSALNPIIYNAVSMRFRRAFRQILAVDYNCFCDPRVSEERPSPCVHFHKNEGYATQQLNPACVHAI